MLLQAADIDLEFFSIRFLLNRFMNDQGMGLYACLVDNRLMGIVYLLSHERLFWRDLEIKYMATLRGKPGPEQAGAPVVKGLGTFLIAGTFLVLHSGPRRAGRIVLDAETGARRFYDGLGFEPMGIAQFALGKPKPLLSGMIIQMACGCQDIGPGVLQVVKKLLNRHVKMLHKPLSARFSPVERTAAVNALGACLKLGTSSALGRHRCPTGG